ncbi:NifX-associated nitrogen fixation protein [Afifella sp. IM 167]|uniref:NifX-associated nitrogen fixation protein n=1 Tax=Afifella sp. IM 167 TaxID=2033586 RepID=UPI001CCCF724|nr:NifX-associated nitrogen fixation protein [Afifella sp. IM 167]
MSTETVVRQVMSDAEAMATPFIKSLVALIRADDTYGVWEEKGDGDLLAEFIVTADERREIPIIGDPDPDLIDRVEKYYRAVGLAVERETGLMASPMMTMHYEGFGRVILTTGKLVIFSKSLRDVHRFGFDSLAALAAEGGKVVAKAMKEIETYPEVARA